MEPSLEGSASAARLPFDPIADLQAAINAYLAEHNASPKPFVWTQSAEGDAEMTVGELTRRGCYLGSNVSYNVRKMVENEYLAHERSVHDRRSLHVRLTEKGIKLRDRLTAMHRRHAEMLSQAAVSADALQAAGVTLRFSRGWSAPPRATLPSTAPQK